MSDQYLIFTDSSSDLPSEYLQKEDIRSLPLSFTIDDRQYYSGDMDIATFYNKMREGAMPVTSQVNVQEAVDKMEPVLRDGKDILYIGFSSGMSGTFNSVRVASQELCEKYPDRKIMLVDSMAVSLGEGMLVYFTNLLKQTGASIDKATQWAQSHVKDILQYITISNLTHVHRGGRISKATTIIGSLLGFQPMIGMEDGKPKVIGAKRGSMAALQNLADNMGKAMQKAVGNICFISHSDCEKDALHVRDLIKKQFNIQQFFINHAGPVLGAHAGPGAIALFMMADNA